MLDRKRQEKNICGPKTEGRKLFVEQRPQEKGIVDQRRLVKI